MKENSWRHNNFEGRRKDMGMTPLFGIILLLVGYNIRILMLVFGIPPISSLVQLSTLFRLVVVS